MTELTATLLSSNEYKGCVHAQTNALSWQSEFRLQQILLAYVLPMVLCLDLCYSAIALPTPALAPVQAPST